MILSKEALTKIKAIIENNYKFLLLKTVGSSVFTAEEKERFKNNLNINENPSLLELVYYNNVLNDLVDSKGPKTIAEMQRQQANRPVSKVYKATEEHINQNYRHLVDKLSASTTSWVEGILREENLNFRNNELRNPGRPESVSRLIRESSVGKLKKALRDASGDASRNFDRIAVTETANAIGLGSADRVLSQTEDRNPQEVYVFRIPVNDSALCRKCREFYLDSDQSPAVYRLATLIGNGTNFGLKMSSWKPIVGATHPNDRESGVLELRPGWKVVAGGSLEYIGEDAWPKYIAKKVRD